MNQILLFSAVAWLAYANGANDNFKGVATLYGSGTTSYRGALFWATIATFAGSLLSIVLAKNLVAVFSGAGLLPPELQHSPQVLISVGSAAAITVFLATVLGMPTSTTHALAGALLGIAWSSHSLENPWPAFLKLFALPLLLSPLLAISITTVLYPLLRRFRLDASIEPDSCVCLESNPMPSGIALAGGPALASVSATLLGASHAESCEPHNGVIRIQAGSATDAVHFLSAGAVCFSRAVNDTPKIAALLIALGGVSGQMSMLLVASAMAMGGLLQSRRVAQTMSKEITQMNPGQGLCANLVTAGLVLFASRLGVPVSTTHVSCGSIFGIGLVLGNTQWRTVAVVGATWITTLPLGAALGASLYWITT